MLPDGGWDNSWGTRQFKWTWWGSRTSDGCQPAYALLADRDPRFAEAAQRNLEQLAACTHDGLLHGGPHYHAQGVAALRPPHVHAREGAGDRARPRRGHRSRPRPARRLPRDEPYGLRRFPEIGTWLASVGEWRATVTEYDWEYKPSGGGHPSGGALSLLYHQRLGPVLVASMTEYQLWEAHNQQLPGDWPTMPLTPRIEAGGATSLSDFAANVSAREADGAVAFEATGRLQTSTHADPPGGACSYRLSYRLDREAVVIEARADSDARLILPVVCTQQDTGARVSAQLVRLARPGGTLAIECEAPAAFDALPERRVFNHVPGFQCAPITLALAAGRNVRVTMRAEA